MTLNPEEQEFNRLSNLTKALVALAARMNPTDAATVADRLIKAVENPLEMNPDRRSRFVEVLACIFRSPA